MNRLVCCGGGDDSSDYTDWDDTPTQEQGNSGQDSGDSSNQGTSGGNE